MNGVKHLLDILFTIQSRIVTHVEEHLCLLIVSAYAEADVGEDLFVVGIASDGKCNWFISLFLFVRIVLECYD